MSCNLSKCDCLNDCGDDPDLESGKVQEYPRRAKCTADGLAVRAELEFQRRSAAVVRQIALLDSKKITLLTHLF